MSVFHVTCSRTAHRPYGHMGSIGFGSPRRSPSLARSAGHRQFTGAPSQPTFDRQAEAVAELQAERARRAIWADCERRPLSIDREIV